MKEQTPIRKLIDKHIEPAWEGAYNADKEALEKDIQEIINAKVLEALERCAKEFENNNVKFRVHDKNDLPVFETPNTNDYIHGSCCDCFDWYHKEKTKERQ